MRFLVGTTAGQSQPHVYTVFGNDAFDLTAANPQVGHDLMALILQGDLSSLDQQPGAAVPVASITPALPVQRPGKI
ncbi:MAG: FAA hydrolase family protein, partial [Pseudomonadota bacterium]